MKMVQTEDPDVLVIKEDAVGCLTIIGGFLFVWGLPVTSTGLGLTNVLVDPTWYLKFTVLAIGVGLMLAGLAGILARSGWTVDRRRGEMVRWWRVLVPVQKTVTSLAGYTKLAYREQAPDPEEEAEPTGWYNIDLIGDASLAPVTIDTFAEYDEGLALAEPLAAFLGFPLEKAPAPGPVKD
jgi:hypothetical protein